MNNITKNNKIQEKIYTVRGLQVMLDSELASLYGVETKVFNQAVKRNIERFPETFRFQVTENEFEILRSQSVTSSSQAHGGRRYLPYVFTEQGVAMLSAVLKSKTAIEISIQIINTFVQMRKFLIENNALIGRLQDIEKRQILFESDTHKKFETLFSALEDNTITPKQGIFYDGQIFDAYVFVANLIKSAKKSIVLLDNYIDETVLNILSKSSEKVSVFLLTKNITPQLKLDVNKYNRQYSRVFIKQFDLSHDRFLIVDEKEIYHIGASLKDLGKKWFAFSKFDINNFGLLEKIKKIIPQI